MEIPGNKDQNIAKTGVRFRTLPVQKWTPVPDRPSETLINKWFAKMAQPLARERHKTKLYDRAEENF